MRFVTLMAAITLSTSVAAAGNSILHKKWPTDIPPETLRLALQTVAKVQRLQLVYSADLVRGVRTPGLHGRWTTEEALGKLLRGTGLTYRYIDKNAVTILPLAAVKTRAAAHPSAGSDPKETPDRATPKADVPHDTDPSPAPSQRPQSAPRPEATKLREVVVTGTHIRGVRPIGSPVLSYSRSEIDASGLPSVAAFVESLPQFFGGGNNENSLGGVLGGAGSNLNFAAATSPNLYGLGDGATVTLLDGHRVAPVGVGEGVDISMIPSVAVKRIDVLEGGASAIYGSDAVAGVVNIVLRQHFQGARTSVRYGNVTHGRDAQYRVSQLLGQSWSSGNAMLAYEYEDNGGLPARDRSFMRSAPYQNFDLVPQAQQNNILASIAQTLNSRVKLHAEGLYSKRSMSENYIDGPAVVQQPIAIEQYDASTGADITLGAGWFANLTGTYSANTAQDTQYINGHSFGDYNMRNGLWAIGAQANGPVFEAPGGKAKVAVGGQFRRETLNSYGSLSNTGGTESRGIAAAFLEFYVPLVGPRNAHPGLRRLALSLAGRESHYSDFGSTFSPKISIEWSPWNSMRVHGSYGRSFRAPSLYDLSEVATPLQPAAYLLPDPRSPIGVSPALVLYGNNSSLHPETARTWTVGGDFLPSSAPGLHLSVTYFHVDYTNRIATPLATPSDLFGVLINSAQYASIVTPNPSPSLVQPYLDSPYFVNLTGGPLAANQIVAFVDNQLANLASTTESGVDADGAYATSTPLGTLGMTLDGAYLLQKRDRFVPGAPYVQSLNTLFNPVNLKLRGGINLTSHAWTSAIFINYINHYQNIQPAFVQPVASWTTVDFSIQYKSAATSGWRKDIRVMLSGQNIFDRAPPYVNYHGFNYDATNANPLGRVLALTVSKRLSW
jgi:iron complex outermembrane receptor protein